MTEDDCVYGLFLTENGVTPNFFIEHYCKMLRGGITPAQSDSFTAACFLCVP